MKNATSSINKYTYSNNAYFFELIFCFVLPFLNFLNLFLLGSGFLVAFFNPPVIMEQLEQLQLHLTICKIVFQFLILLGLSFFHFCFLSLQAQGLLLLIGKLSIFLSLHHFLLQAVIFFLESTGT